MDKADIEKFRRVGGLGETIDINGEKFYFKPLPLKHLPELMEFSKIVIDDKDALMKKENASKLLDILKLFVINSYPDLGKDENIDVLDSFIINNLEIIQEVLIKTSIPKNDNINAKDKANSVISRINNG